jgi:galactonate dehydratase
VKIAPFDGVRRDQLSRPETRRAIELGLERVMAIREAIGPKPDLLVDCHWRFDEPTALEVLAKLAPAGLHWLECPVPESWSWHGSLARLRAAAREQGVLLAGAELQTGLDGFRPFFESPLLDVIMPDVKYAGGIAETLRIVVAARDGGVLSSLHNPTGPVCTYASLHVAACAPELPYLELQLGESPLYFDVVGSVRPRFENGCLFIPEAPGLGVELDEAVCRAHPYRPVPYGPEEHLA